MLQMECVLKTMPRIISSNYISTYIIIIEISYFWWYFLIKLQLLWNSICTFLIRNFDFTLFETIIFYDVLTQHFHVSEIKWCSSFAWWLGIKIIELSFDIYRCIIFSCSGFLLSDSMEMKPVTTRKLRRRPNDPMPLPEKRRKQNPDILLTFNGFFMSSFSYLHQVSSPIVTSPLFSLFKTLNLFQMGWMAEFLSPILNYP